MTDERERALTRTDSGLLRAVEAEARRRERIRIGDALRGALAQVDGHDGKSARGRLKYGLEQALAVVPLPDYRDGGPWTELAGSVTGDVDGIDVGVWLETEDGSPDTMPIRLKVVDGADDATAYAYLTPREADELVELLLFARQRHAEWLATLDGEAVQNPGDGAAGG